MQSGSLQTTCLWKAAERGPETVLSGLIMRGTIMNWVILSAILAWGTAQLIKVINCRIHGGKSPCGSLSALAACPVPIPHLYVPQLLPAAWSVDFHPLNLHWAWHLPPLSFMMHWVSAGKQGFMQRRLTSWK